MTKKMLQFVDLKQETPEKRNTNKRNSDFNRAFDSISNLWFKKIDSAQNLIFQGKVIKPNTKR